MSNIGAEVCTLYTPCAANKNAVALCLSYGSPWYVLRVLDIETCIRCRHVMWRGQTFEGCHQLFLFLWGCCHGHRSSMRRDPHLFAPWVDICSLQLVTSEVLPKLEVLSSIYEWLLPAQLRLLLLKRSAVHQLWCNMFPIHNIFRRNCPPGRRCGIHVLDQWHH